MTKLLNITMTMDGVILAGGWLTQAEVNHWSSDHKRNAIISNLARCSSSSVQHYQGCSDQELVGKAAILIYLSKLEPLSQLKNSSDDEQRNSVIWLLDNKYSSSTAQHYQAFDNCALVSKAEIVLYLLTIYSPSKVKSTSDGDHRNGIIFELNIRTQYDTSVLQGMNDQQLVNIAVGLLDIDTVKLGSVGPTGAEQSVFAWMMSGLVGNNSRTGLYSWSAWDELGGDITSGPAVTNTGSRFDIFHRGTDGKLTHRWTEGNGSWSQEQLFIETALQPNRAPAAASIQTGGGSSFSTGSYVAFRGSDDKLNFGRDEGGWSLEVADTYTEIPTRKNPNPQPQVDTFEMNSCPSICAVWNKLYKYCLINVFAIGKDGYLYQKLRARRFLHLQQNLRISHEVVNKITWTPWTKVVNLTGGLVSSPSALITENGTHKGWRIDLVAVKNDRTLLSAYTNLANELRIKHQKWEPWLAVNNQTYAKSAPSLMKFVDSSTNKESLQVFHMGKMQIPYSATGVSGGHPSQFKGKVTWASENSNDSEGSYLYL